MLFNIYHLNTNLNGAVDQTPLRRACEQHSRDFPGRLVLGLNVFGKFPMLDVREAGNHRITADDVRATDLGGYWLDGRFQLFSPRELALLDVDDDNECPVGDPDCFGDDESCHDACESPAGRFVKSCRTY